MNLEEYLKYTPKYPSLYKPAGEETDWLSFSAIELRGTQLLIIDASHVPNAAEGLLIVLDPGIYQVNAKVMNYGIDHLISRLGVVSPNVKAICVEKIGDTWTDVALTGVCDHLTFSTTWEEDPEGAWAIVEPTIFGSMWGGGIVELDKEAGAVMPFVQSGFGDGTYPVFELIVKRKRVGVEIEFISQGVEYRPRPDISTSVESGITIRSKRPGMMRDLEAKLYDVSG